MKLLRPIFLEVLSADIDHKIKLMTRFFVYCLLLFNVCISATAASRTILTTREIIIDTDVGIDDVIAIVYLLKQPDINVKAITIEGDGNAHCKPAFENIQSLLKLLRHPTIPIACGRSTPLSGTHHFPAANLQTEDTLAGTPLIKSTAPFSSFSAEMLLVKTLRSASPTLDIVALGPLTSIAEVLNKHPELKNKIRMIYEMGGAIHVSGNITSIVPKSTNHRAEWNIYIDPYAAEKVFHSGVPITLIPLDVTDQVHIDESIYKAFKQRPLTPAAQLIYQLLIHNHQMIIDKTWFFWDPMAAVIASNEEIATIKTLPLSVSLQPESTSGATIIDKQYGAPIRVCTAIDSKRFKNRLLQGIQQSL